MTVETLYKGFKEGLKENKENLEGNISNLIEMGYDTSVLKAIQAEYEREEGKLSRFMDIWIRLNYNRYSPEELTIKGNKAHVNNKHGKRMMEIFFCIATWTDE